MAKEETLKEAWEKLPAWKKTWFKILAIIFVLGLISSFVLFIPQYNAMNDAEKEANKLLENARNDAEKEANKILEEANKILEEVKF